MMHERLTAIFCVRFHPSEAVRIRQAAKRSGMTVSAYVRHAALRDADLPTIKWTVGVPSITVSGGRVHAFTSSQRWH